MSTLYNKIPFFKKLAAKPLGGSAKKEDDAKKAKAEAAPAEAPAAK